MKTHRYVAIGAAIFLFVSAGIVMNELSWRSKSETKSPSQGRAASLFAEEKHLDETVWADEVEAQKYEEFFVGLWDELRAGKDKLQIFNGVPFKIMEIGAPTTTELHDHGILITHFGKPSTRLDRSGWLALIGGMKRKGIEVVQTEWHHSRFERRGDGQYHSVAAMVIHAIQPKESRKFIVTGNLQVDWERKKNRDGHWIPRVIDATDLTIAEWKGPQVFKEVDTGFQELAGRPGQFHPLLVYDLNHDGLPDIILPSQNVVLWNRGGMKFTMDRLCAEDPGEVSAAVIADFAGDGVADLLCVVRGGFLNLYRGDAQGKFSTPPQEIRATGAPLPLCLNITAGDVDGNGTLDLWVTQYASPTLRGHTPTPYYDANDGHPAYLLLNRGDGQFTDATESSGLAKKRFRRAYSSSLVDFDQRGVLDLLVVSDFAGVDLYHNDGHGKFTDITDTALGDRNNFGMSHTFGDYNGDGHLDFYTCGMSSTTARRLDALNAGRADFPLHQQMRKAMGYGNRMFLWDGAGKFRQPAFRDHVARTNWTWGSTTLDFDNNGTPDIFVANGFFSNKTAKDYCTQFWCHDIYSPAPNRVFGEYLNKKHEDFFDRGGSWDGFQHKCLLMNEAGKDFLNVAFLFDVAFEYDARSVVSADLDGDGKMDLLMIEHNDRLGNRAALHVYQNNWPEPNHWIGVRLQEEPGFSPIGAYVTVGTAQGKQVATFVTGDSLVAQHDTTKHFGLGKINAVDYIEVRWLNGAVTRIEKPAADRYYLIHAPAK